LPQGAFNGFLGGLVALSLWRDFAGEKDGGARKARSSDGIGTGLLVPVGAGRVYMAVARIEGVLDNGFGVGGGTRKWVGRSARLVGWVGTYVW
jgi:hypothetical protein